MKTKRTFNKDGCLMISIFAICSAVLAIVAVPVSAATFTVTTFDDELATNGACSLREAIVNANDNALTHTDCLVAGEAGPALDVINLPAGTFELTIAGVDERCDGAVPCMGTGTDADPWVPVITSDASIGDLDITDDVTITGAGSDQTTIIWGTTGPAPYPLTGDTDPLSGDRIFHVAIPADAIADIASVVIQGLTAVNGEVGLKPTVAADVCIDDGSGVTTVYTPANLNAYDIAVTDTGCGTIGDDGKLVGGTIKIDQFRRMGGGIALGGGYAVATYDEANVGTAPVIDPGGEGGLEIGNVSLNDVVVINNWSGGDGGGIHSIAPATISRSKISGNTSAGGNGGGVYNEANLTISDTLIGKVFDAVSAAAHPELTNPNYGENGGGMFFTGSPQTTTTILRSAINGNEAIGGAGIAGRVARFDITNTTISSNTAKDVGAGIHTAGPVYLQNVTVADNLATTTAPGGGAGLSSFSNGQYFFGNTLLSNNMVASAEGGTPRLANCGCAGGGGCAFGDLNSQGYNLEDGDTCELDQLGDKKNTPTQLIALADNGGLTETHELTFIATENPGNSPALDTGDDNNCPNNDQRSSIRPFDGDEDGTAKCDIGAFELANFTTDLQISNMLAPDEVFKGDEFTVTVTILNNTAADTSVALDTTLPAGITFVSATATGGDDNSCLPPAAGVVTCTIGALGNTAEATVTLTLSAATVGDAVITASVSGDSTPTDLNTANNTHSVTVGVIGVADLELSATANTSSVVVGNEVTVTFTVANLGADDATEVSLFGTIPVEASLVSATPDNGTTCTQSGADVFCELGNLAVAGPAINVVVVMRADLTGVAGTVIDVSATADAKQRDPDTSNNTVAASVTITAAPSGGGDSGWCSYNPDARFDPVLPGLVLAGLAYLGWRLRKTGAR